MEPALTAAARRDLERLPIDQRTLILDGIERFFRDGYGDVRKLKDVHPARWRLRVGRYRIIYAYEERVPVIYRIDDRKDAYR